MRCAAAGHSLTLLLTLLLTWLVSACGGGGSAAPAPLPLPQGLPDLTQPRLLSDTELRASPKASDFTPPAAVQAWLAERHVKLRSLVVDADFSDLQPLAATLSQRRIVMLGESSHGSREFNLAKVRLVKFLHQRLGFSVLAFESSTLGCALQDRALAAQRPAAASATCLFPVWRTEELAELMRYVASTQGSSRPLRLAGFDVQVSSSLEGAEALVAWLLPVLEATGEPLLANAAGLIRTAHQAGLDGYQCRHLGQACAAFDRARPGLLVELQRADEQLMLAAQAAQAGSALQRERSLAALALMSLRDRLLSAEAGRGQSLANFQDREPFMAKALTRLAREVYPQERLIVWAHNAHISTETTGFPDSGPPMASFLKADWGEALYGLGLFMLRGQSTLDATTRSVAGVVALPSRGLEAHAASLGLGAFWLPVPVQDEPGAGDDWLHQPLLHLHWGYVERRERIDRNYNGLLFIDNSSLPRYTP